jgi:lysophospholipase L1-like esterase
MRDHMMGWLRRAWVNVGVTLVILAMLEGAFQLVFWARDRGRPVAGSLTEDRTQLAYPGQSWVHRYMVEFHAAGETEWRSYVYWRSHTYHGTYINIDAQGLRHTWNASPSPTAGQPKIFMFGGSTMWGWGSRDEFTIPSYVSKTLAKIPNAAPWVVNYGEAGYVTTQEVLTLMLELRRGNIPDVVVFYDGVNDAWSSFQNGVAGIPQNEFNRVAEFNSRDRLNLRGGVLEKLGMYRVARSVAGALGRSGGSRAARRQSIDPVVVDATVGTYFANVKLVNALAREFGFRAVFFWQPTMYSKKVLSPDEDRWRRQGEQRGGGVTRVFAEQYRAFDAAFKRRLGPTPMDNVHDLSGIFERDPRTIFIDRFHATEAGNETVAGAIAEVVQRLVGAK